MQVIVTKFIGPTNTRGARVKVTAERGSVTVPWDYGAGTYQNHAVAAMAALVRWEWTGRWVGGFLPGNLGYAFVRDPSDGGPTRVEREG